MKIRFIVSVVAGIVVVLVIAAVVVLQFFDVDQYRNVIEKKASAMIGRKLTLAGPVSLSIGWGPVVVFNDVQLANAKWGTRRDMIKLKRLEVQVSLLSLLFGENIEVNRLLLVEPDIWLETNKQGRGNWKLELGKGEEKEDAGAPAIPLISYVRLLDSKVAFKDGQSGEKYDLSLEKIEAETEGFDAPLRFDASGNLNKAPVSVKGEVGPLHSIIDDSPPPYPLDIAAQWGGLSLKVKGTVSDPLRMKNMDLKVTAEAKSLQLLRPITGDMVAEMGRVSFNANVQGDLSKIQVKGIESVFGRTDVKGRIEASLFGKKPKISANLDSDRFDLDELVPPEEGDSKAKKKSAPDKKGAKQVFSNDPLPLDTLKMVDADLRFSGKEIHVRGIVLHAAKVRLSLQDGKMSVKSLEGRIGGGTLKGGGELNARSSPASLSVNLKGTGFDVGKILKEAQVKEFYTGKGDLAVNVKGRGNSVAAIMASLNGETKAVLGKGKLKGKAEALPLPLAVGGFNKVLGTLTTGNKKDSDVHCAVNNFTIKNGIAKSQVMLVDTEYSTVVGKGDINLDKETLNLVITPKPKSVTLNVAVPVNVGGTLASPTFQPDKLAIARKVGGIAALFVFPPAAILGFADLGTDRGQECLKIAKGKVPTPEMQKTSATEKVLKDVESGVKDVGKKLKGLIGK